MFIIVIGFLIAGIIVANKLGAHGANAILKTGENWSRKAGLAVGAGAGYVVGSSPIGIGGLSNYSARKVRERAAAVHEKDADGNYIYDSPIARMQRSKFAAKMQRGAQSVIAAPSKMKFGSAKSRAERLDATEKAAKEQKAAYSKINREHSLKEAIEDDSAGLFTTSVVRQAVAKSNAKVVSNASVADLTANAELLKKNPQSLAYVSHANYKKLRENKEGTFTEDELRKFDDASKDHFMELTGTDLQNTIQKASPAELAEHDVAFLSRRDVARQIDPQTLTGMVRNGLSQEKRDAIRKSIESQYNEIKDPNLPQTARTPEEQKNIEKLYNWFNNDNKMSV